MASARSKTWSDWKSLARRWVEGHVLALPTLSGVVLVLLVCGVPVTAWWVWVVEGLHLSDLWPLLLVACAGWFWLAGVHRHRKTGLPVHLVRASLLGAFVLLGAACWLLQMWAADWSVAGFIAECGILAFAAALLTCGLFAFTEWWRTGRVNDAVVAEVQADLAGPARRFIDGIDAHQVDLLPWLNALLVGHAPVPPGPNAPLPRAWGSLHCLEIVQDHYDRCRDRLLGHVAGTPGRELRDYVAAGEALVAYLSLGWPTEALRDKVRGWRLAEVRREMITLALWFNFRRPAPATPSPRALAQLSPSWWFDRRRPGVVPFVGPEQIVGWIGGPDGVGGERSFHACVPAGCEAYRDVLERAFRVGGPGPDPNETTITAFLQAFTRLDAQRPDMARGDPYETCAATLLALTDGIWPDPLRFDLWMALRIRKQSPLFLRRSSLTDTEPARCCARVALTELYHRWQEGTAPGWQDGLQGRERHAAQVMVQDDLYRVVQQLLEGTRLSAAERKALARQARTAGREDLRKLISD